MSETFSSLIARMSLVWKPAYRSAPEAIRGEIITRVEKFGTLFQTGASNAEMWETVMSRTYNFPIAGAAWV